MLYVDGMNGVIRHAETIQWLYTLVGSKVHINTSLMAMNYFVGIIFSVSQSQTHLSHCPEQMALTFNAFVAAF